LNSESKQWILNKLRGRFAVTDATAAGVIYESAGTKTPPEQSKTLQGAQFTRNIAQRSGVSSDKHRMIVQAVIEMRPDILHKIDNVIDDAVRQFNAVMK
jgi:hypothetical protein